MTRPVLARAPAPGLSWVRGVGAESCITSVDLAKKVEAILGSAVFVSASEAELVIEGYVQPKKGGGFEARLVVVDASGRWLGNRDLAVDQLDCSALNEALALVIAVTINPQSGLAGESILSAEMAATLDGLFSKDAAEVAADEQAASANEPADSSTPAKKAGEERTETFKVPPNPYYKSKKVETTSTLYFGAYGSIGTGLQPSIAPGIGAEVAYESVKVFRIGLRGGLSFSTAITSDLNKGEGVRFQLFTLTPVVCPFSVGMGPHSVSGCAGLMAGAITAKPNGFSVNKKNSEFILNSTFEFRVKWTFADYFSPRFGVAAILPLIQHAYSYRNEAGATIDLYRMGQIAFGADFGLEAKY